LLSEYRHYLEYLDGYRPRLNEMSLLREYARVFGRCEQQLAIGFAFLSTPVGRVTTLTSPFRSNFGDQRADHSLVPHTRSLIPGDSC
jgi:hypothetical protein